MSATQTGGPALPDEVKPEGRAQRMWRIGTWLAVAAVLSATFCLYWRPDVAFDLATRIWSCI
jgi:hypothetical protein